MSSIHRFYIELSDIDGDTAVMTGQDAKHLVNVLRLGPKTEVELADGHGTHYLSEIEDASSKRVVFKIIERKLMYGESPVHITIAQAMLKDKKMDPLLRHLTELGIREWIPFFASRSVPCQDGYSKNREDFGTTIKTGRSRIKTTDVRVERWERIAKESIKQCGRSLLPLIHKPVSFDEMLSEAASYGEKIAFWEKATTPVDSIRVRQRVKEEYSPEEHEGSSSTLSEEVSGDLCRNRDKGDQNRIFVMIGPEGGFSEHEIDAARQRGFQPFSLGNRILRAETASIAACTLIQNIFGDI